MRVLFFDIDTLRSDHLGCYGYQRDTSPNIDAVAKEGARFNKYYCPNAPCLPSRASLVTGLYGIHTGVVGHGGTAADLRLQQESRSFTDDISENNLFMQFRQAGMHTVSFSSFAERHSSWWFNAGLNEWHNIGRRGGESAEMVLPGILDWLSQNAEKDNWFLHINLWDAHTPYRTPASYPNYFENQPLCSNWISKDVFAQHLLHIGPHGANEINMWNDEQSSDWPKHPGKLETLQDVKNFIDQYDCGIRYADQAVGKIVEYLKQANLYDDNLAIIISSDHGENMGELGIYGEHATADHPTCHIPMIIKWPGTIKGQVVKGFHDTVDLLPTVRELLDTKVWGNRYQPDGVSYAQTLRQGVNKGKPSLVLTQAAHVCQRSARFGQYIYIRTIHGGYHLFPEEMLYDLEKDPYEQNNIAAQNPEVCAQGAKIILDWTESMMKSSYSDGDPLWTVMREGGPEHCRGQLKQYMQRLKNTPREYGVELLEKQYPNEKYG